MIVDTNYRQPATAAEAARVAREMNAWAKRRKEAFDQPATAAEAARVAREMNAAAKRRKEASDAEQDRRLASATAKTYPPFRTASATASARHATPSVSPVAPLPRIATAPAAPVAKPQPSRSTSASKRGPSFNTRAREVYLVRNHGRAVEERAGAPAAPKARTLHEQVYGINDYDGTKIGGAR